jgi:hypothetical protein
VPFRHRLKAASLFSHLTQVKLGLGSLRFGTPSGPTLVYRGVGSFVSRPIVTLTRPLSSGKTSYSEPQSFTSRPYVVFNKLFASACVYKNASSALSVRSISSTVFPRARPTPSSSPRDVARTLASKELMPIDRNRNTSFPASRNRLHTTQTPSVASSSARAEPNNTDQSRSLFKPPPQRDPQRNIHERISPQM